MFSGGREIAEDFVVIRVGCPWLPDWIDPRANLAGDDGFSSGADPWQYAVPWVFRALADPMRGTVVPRAPRPGGPFAESLAYWTSLIALLRWSLGWARMDRGLRWWYDAGKPTSDPRLALVSQVWAADGQLDWLAAWLWSDASIDNQWLESVTGYVDDRIPIGCDRSWLENQARFARASGLATPIGGGYDPLHLSVHCDTPLEQPAVPVLLHASRSERRAVLVAESMSGWYRGLAELAVDLPDIGDRSWKIDVFVKPVGFLGTYRRSRQTQLWFAGPHSVHVRGV